MKPVKPPFQERAKKYSVEKLVKLFYKGKKLTYVFFWRPDRVNLSVGCLSQWQKTSFQAGGYEYRCAEQYLMAQKALFFNDFEAFEKILAARRPDKMKALGRQVKNFDENKWDTIKFQLVLEGNFYKFTQNKEMADLLTRTNNKILVEASPFDRVWGVGLDEKNEKIHNPNYWKGENLLGFALMELRDLLESGGFSTDDSRTLNHV